MYCRSGNRAGVAVGMVEDWGYTNVYNIGGYESIMDQCGDCGSSN
jgi:rhodanese-related sulfurtransferase